MIQSLPSLAKLNNNFEHLKKPLFSNVEVNLSMNDEVISLYLDINSQDKIKDVGIVSKSIDEAYLELFSLFLLGKEISHLKKKNEKNFLSILEVSDQTHLKEMFPLLNPCFLLLEKAIEKYEGSDIAISCIEKTDEALLCRCENISKEAFKRALDQNKGSFQKAASSLNIAASCGSCFEMSEKLFDEYLVGSCFLEGKSYADWAIILNEILITSKNRKKDFRDYHFHILSFENLSLKIRVTRGESHYNRKDLTEILSGWIRTEANSLITVSVVF